MEGRGEEKERNREKKDGGRKEGEGEMTADKEKENGREGGRGDKISGGPAGQYAQAGSQETRKGKAKVVKGRGRRESVSQR